jgi:hypothetical protein
MKRLLILLFIVLLVSCQSGQSKLFDEVNKMARFDGIREPTLIQYGEEEGFLEPMMSYGIYKVDSLDFKKLRNKILENDKFKKGIYYLNIELNDYIFGNKLEIINMPNSLIYENKFDRTYRVFLLSDKTTFVICKINS